jgi:hypothetical protein
MFFFVEIIIIYELNRLYFVAAPTFRVKPSKPYH